ncbi:MAG: hypothetical protein JSW28_00500 [Thermoplasmata archaeon]|nr:MAG: hypothetical protein JSW28_00500 [Thermoplasmata archaeon]
MDIGVNCSNVGVSGVNASITYSISFYNSSATRTIGSEFYNISSLPGLPAGGVSGLQTGVWIPPNEPGDYYVIVVVDSGNTTSEINELNNTFLIHFVIGPDLIPTNVSVNGDAAVDESQIWYVGPGEVIVIGSNATNVGFSGTGMPFNISFYNTSVGGSAVIGDENPFNITLGALDPGEDSGHWTWLWTVPWPAGDYYVNITVDLGNVTWELNELNNTFTIHFVVAPDLSPTNVSVNGTPITSFAGETVILHPGQVIIIGANATNVGLSSTGVFQFNMTFWNSTSTGTTFGTFLYDTGVLGPLNSSEFTADFYVIWVAPSPDKPTDYFINITVDSTWAVSEWVETNNTFILNITVDAPDLTPDRIEVEAANGSISVVYDEPSTLPTPFVSETIYIPVGSPVNITFTVGNIGGQGMTMGTNITAYNVSGVGGGPIDDPFFESAPQAVFLPAGGSLPFIINWPNPGIAGFYYINISIDYTGTLDIVGRIIELNETNNTFTFVINITSTPITTPRAGTPVFQPGVYWYVNSTTELNFTVTGGNPPFTTYYRIYNMSNGSYATEWINYTDPVQGGNFTMIWGEGTYLIEFNSTDSIGGAEPTKNLTIIVDDSLPLTTLIIGNPKYPTSALDFLNITSITPLDLSAVDWPLGTSPAGPGILNASGINGLPVSGLFYKIRNLDSSTNMTEWVEYLPGTSFYFDPLWLDGNYSIEFNSTDNLGQKEIPKLTTVYLDNTGPQTTISVGDPNWTASAQDRINVTSSTPFTLDAYEAVGSGANISTIQFRIINVDTNRSSGWIFGTAFDVATDYPFWAIDGDGNYSVLFRALDLLGNLGATGTLDIYVDDTPPVTVLAIGEPKHRALDTDLWNITSLTPLNLTADDGPGCGVDYIQYRIYNLTWDSGWNAYSGNFTMPGGLSNGEYTIEYGSYDHLGNYQVYTETIYLDNIPPATSINVGDPKHPSVPILNITSATPLNLTSTDGTGAGVASIHYKVYNNDTGLDVGDWTEYSPGTLSFFLSGLPDGNYTVIFNATDNLGWVEPNNFYTLYLDNTGPVSDIIVGDPKYPSTATDHLNVTSDAPFSLNAYEAVGSGADLTTMEYDITFLDGAVSSGWTLGTIFNISSAFAQGDGNYSIRFRCRDSLGNLGPEGNITIYVDDTPPESVLTVGYPRHRDSSSDMWNITSASLLNLTADDGFGSGVDFIQYRIYNNTFNTSWTAYTADFVLPPTWSDGIYTIEYRGYDNLGNPEPVKNESLNLDNTPPVTNITILTPQYRRDEINDTLNISSATGINFVISDGSGSQVNFTRYRIFNSNYDTGWRDYTIQTSVPSAWSDDYYTIEFYSEDFLGNTEIVRQEIIYLDNTPPETNVTVEEPKYRANTSHILNVTGRTRFILSSEDMASGVETILYQIGTGTIRIYNGSYFVISGPEGLYTVRYWARDNVWNAEPQHVMQVIVDNTPPQSNITFGDPQYRANESADILNITDATPINITSVDGGAIPVDVDFIEYMIDDDGNLSNGNFTGWIIYNGTFDLSDFPDGQYHLYYHAVDFLGNTEALRNVTIIVDSSPPDTDFHVVGVNHTVPGLDDTWWVAPDTELSLTSLDIGAPPVGIWYTAYRVDNIYHEFDDGFEDIDTSTLANGTHTIRFWGVDLLGNTEELAYVTVVIDDAGPDMDIIPSPDAVLPTPLSDHPTLRVNFSEETNLTIDATDMGVPPGDTPSGVWYIQYKIDPEDPNATWQNITADRYNIFDLVVEWYGNETRGYWHHNISFRAFDNLGWEGPTATIWFYIEGDVEPPLPPLLRVFVRDDDILLEWEPSISPDIHHYLIYKSDTRRGFDFSEAWVDTSEDEDGERLPLRTTWNDTGAVPAGREFYYTIRGVDARGNIGYTSNIGGKVTMTFTHGYNAFALPLEPFANDSAVGMLDFAGFAHHGDTVYRYDEGAEQWIGRPKFLPRSLDNFTLEMGESYMIYILEDEVEYTFTGAAGTSIRFIEGVGAEEDFRTGLDVQYDGEEVVLSWEPAAGAAGYAIYRGDTRVGPGSLSDHTLEPLDEVDSQTRSWTDDDMSQNEHYYMVVAKSGQGEESSTYALGVYIYDLGQGYHSFSVVFEPNNNLTYASLTGEYFTFDSDTVYYYNKHLAGWEGHPRFLPENINNGKVLTGSGFLVFTYAKHTRFAVIGS